MSTYCTCSNCKSQHSYKTVRVRVSLTRRHCTVPVVATVQTKLYTYTVGQPSENPKDRNYYYHTQDVVPSKDEGRLQLSDRAIYKSSASQKALPESRNITIQHGGESWTSIAGSSNSALRWYVVLLWQVPPAYLCAEQLRAESRGLRIR